MKYDNFFKLIKIDGYSATPKYRQVYSSIVAAIEDGKLKKNQILPSINELSYLLDLSRETAQKAYNQLKSHGVIVSIPGKGNYISNKVLKKKIKIFLLFNKLSYHKKLIYDSFVGAIGDEISIDFYIYNNDFTIFKKLIAEKCSEYSHCVIIPHFVEGGEQACDVINAIPRDKLIILDKKVPGVIGNCACIYENFEKDIYGALVQLKDRLSKYQTLKMVFPEHSYYPKEIIFGFRKFCQHYAFDHMVVSDVNLEAIKKGEVYINLMDDDLVTLIEKILSQDMVLGEDVGLISYNETPLKKFLLNGITTISSEFESIGKLAAEMILMNKQEFHEVPFYVRPRPSL